VAKGFEASIVRLEGGADRRAALISGRVDILGASIDDFAVSLDQGVTGVAIACADYSNGADAILGGGSIRSLGDLKGKTVAAQEGLPNHFFLLYSLDRAGIAPSLVKVRNMNPDDAGAAFIAKSIDAAATWEPHISKALASRPDAKVLVSSREYPEALLDLFVASHAFARDSSAVRRFREAWDEAIDLMSSKPDSTNLLVSQALAIPISELPGMLAGVQLVKNSRCAELLLPKLSEISETVNRIWRQAGFLKQPVDLPANIRLR
jgi:NitT/TauT family transport system substrate-binding protein